MHSVDILKLQKWILGFALTLATLSLVSVIFDIRISKAQKNIIEIRLNKFSKEKTSDGE